MTKRYFKHEAESDLGEGMAYLEISDGWPTRQVELYGERWRWRWRWRWGDAAHDEWLADQPFEALELTEEHAIPNEEFERVWQEATRRPPSAG